ncbi:MAG: hypothetical protein ABUJ92_00240 [Desulfobacterales bacterium]
MDKKLEKLITGFGNKAFNCGEFDGPSPAEYDKLVEKAEEAKKKLIEYIEGEKE